MRIGVGLSRSAPPQSPEAHSYAHRRRGLLLRLAVGFTGFVGRGWLVSAVASGCVCRPSRVGGWSRALSSAARRRRLGWQAHTSQFTTFRCGGSACALPPSVCSWWAVPRVSGLVCVRVSLRLGWSPRFRGWAGLALSAVGIITARHGGQAAVSTPILNIHLAQCFSAYAPKHYAKRSV